MAIDAREKADFDYFKSLAWCAKLLEDPDFKYAPTMSRQPKQSTEDAFFAEALRTPHTISKCLSMYKTPREPDAKIEEVRTLLQLGYQLSGYPYVAHGGVTCFILDEISGILLTYNQGLEKPLVTVPIVTASLNVKFLGKIPAPGVVLVVARMKEIRGRKHFIETTIQDENGVILAKGEALFIAINTIQEKL